MLGTGAHLAALTADSVAMADLAAEPGALESTVPACPGWNGAELVGHMGGVYSWVVAAIGAGGDPPGPGTFQQPGPDADLVEWFRARRDDVVDLLTSREPDSQAWNFVGGAPQTVGWWRRRQALETAVHLFDLEQAVGRPGTVDPELAADGIDELLTMFLPRYLGRNPVEGLTGTFHIHCTDTDGEWTVDLSDADPVVTREHSKADGAARGPASGLYLWLWNRLGASEAGIETFGNESVLEAWASIKL